jgi:hypothetical protein
MKISAFKQDDKKVSEGVWVEAGEGLRLLIASFNSAAYAKEIKRIGKPYRTQIRSGRIANDVLVDLTKQAASRFVLLDWENLTEDDEVTEIPFTPEKALELFNDCPQFWQLVHDCANDAALFAIDEEEDGAGN